METLLNQNKSLVLILVKNNILIENALSHKNSYLFDNGKNDNKNVGFVTQFLSRKDI